MNLIHLTLKNLFLNKQKITYLDKERSVHAIRNCMLIIKAIVLNLIQSNRKNIL